MSSLVIDGCSQLCDLFMFSQDTQTIVPGHRAIMAAVSPKLANHLRLTKQPPSSSTQPVRIDFVFPTLSSINLLCEYIYSNHMIPENIEPRDLKLLSDFATEWNIETLKQILFKHVTIDCEEPTTAPGRFDAVKSCVNLETLWMDKEFCDVNIVIVGAEDTITLPASRIILAAKSNFFRTMFTCDWSETNSPTVTVTVADPLPFSVDDVAHVIEFIYRGARCLDDVKVGLFPRVSPHIEAKKLEVHDELGFLGSRPFQHTDMGGKCDGIPIASQTIDCPLLHAAIYFGCESLQHFCEEILQPKLLTINHVCDLWTFADSVLADSLSDACLKMVQENFVAVSATPSFHFLPYHLLHQVLVCGRICCNTMIVFEIIDSWKQRQIPSVQAQVAGLLPPNTLFTREWKQMLLQGTAYP